MPAMKPHALPHPASGVHTAHAGGWNELQTWQRKIFETLHTQASRRNEELLTPPSCAGDSAKLQKSKRRFSLQHLNVYRRAAREFVLRLVRLSSTACTLFPCT